MVTIDTLPLPALDLLNAPGPFATAYIPTPSAIEDAASRFEGSVKSALESLERAGASKELVGRIRDEAMGHDHADGETLVVVANADDAWSWAMTTESEHVDVAVGPLPRIGRLVEEARHTLPHIVVLIDREGADIDVIHEGQDLVRHLSVEGDADVIHKSPAGGWSQRRFQQRVENTWEENAQEVAGTVGDIHGAIRPHAVFVAGDERAAGFLVEHLPEEVRDVVHRLEHGSRADGADLDGMRADVDHELADLIARHTVELLERFSSALPNGAAVEGIEDTLSALFERRAERVLVHVDPSDDRTAWFGPEAGQVAADPSTFETLGIEAQEGPLLEVCLRAAHGTGAAIWFVPGHGPSVPAEGLGAVLRG